MRSQAAFPKFLNGPACLPVESTRARETRALPGSIQPPLSTPSLILRNKHIATNLRGDGQTFLKYLWRVVSKRVTTEFSQICLIENSNNLAEAELKTQLAYAGEIDNQTQQTTL